MAPVAVTIEKAWLIDGTKSGALWTDKAKASEASQQIIAFTNSIPDPLNPSFPYTNPWATKKENKGRKDAPPVPKKVSQKI